MPHGVTMASNGRLVIPAPIRAELRLENGGRLVARVQDGAIVLEPIAHAIARAQELVRRYVPEGVSLADELIEERRREAGLE